MFEIAESRFKSMTGFMCVSVCGFPDYMCTIFYDCVYFDHQDSDYHLCKNHMLFSIPLTFFFIIHLGPGFVFCCCKIIVSVFLVKVIKLLSEIDASVKEL